MTHAKRTFKGAIHLHTTYSHDGVLTLEELARFLRERGYDFIAVTEHSQDMSAESLSELEAKAAALSSDSFLIIPGMEFTCTATIHILGIGVTSLCPSEDPSTVIDHIHAHGGLAVLAHPSNREYPIDPSWVAKLDGCEIWNNRNGKWLPQMKAVRKFHGLQKAAPGLLAFAGLDLHGAQGYSEVATWLSGPSLDRVAVFQGFKNGHFSVGSPWLRIASNGKLTALQEAYLWSARTMLNALRSARNGIMGGRL